MRAAVLQEKDSKVQVMEFSKPEPEEGEVLVEIRAAALNRRDYWITKGLYPGIRYPIILGSDACGFFEGRRVILNPNQNWGAREQVQSKEYTILGTPHHGTLAEWVAVQEDRIHHAPEHLTDEQVAALPLAGMTAYRALFSKAQAKSEDKVLISGIGGGVALMAFQMAVAIGCDVYVTSGSNDKIERAIKMGAKGGVNYKQDDWGKKLTALCGGFDVIIDSAGGDGFTELVKACRPAGRIAIYGGTRGKINGLSPQVLFWKQISLFGSTMASDKEFSEMLSFVNQHKLVPVVDKVFPLSMAADAIATMESASQFGKLVLKIS